MVQIVRKSDSEFICTFDYRYLSQYMNEYSKTIQFNVQTIRDLSDKAIDMIAKKYNLDCDQLEYSVNIYSSTNESEELNEVVVVVKTGPPSDMSLWEEDSEEMEVIEDEYLEDDEKPDVEIVDEEDVSWEGQDYYDQNAVVYGFHTIEQLIDLQTHTGAFDLCQSKLYHLQGLYVAVVYGLNDMDPEVANDLRSLFEEHAIALKRTTAAYVEDYGKLITADVSGMIDILTGK